MVCVVLQSSLFYCCFYALFELLKRVSRTISCGFELSNLLFRGFVFVVMPMVIVVDDGDEEMGESRNNAGGKYVVGII